MPARFRADHVGSFLRSQELQQAHTAQQRGELPLPELRALEDREILKVLDLQRQVGIDVFTDGEYRRGGWATDFAEAVAGFVPGTPPVVMTWHASPATPATQAAPQPAGTGTGGPVGRIIGERLRPQRRITAHEVAFLKQHAGGPIKMTMPAASYVVARGYKPGVTDTVYADRSEVLRDVAGIVQGEVAALAADGVAYIQLDNPHYPDYISEERREQWRSLGVDADQALAEDVEADNATLRGVDRGQVVLGLVTTKSPELEPQDQLLRRVEEAAKYVPLEDLALSPQCGFASTAPGNLLTPDEQRRKLELVVDTARKVWG